MSGVGSTEPPRSGGAGSAAALLARQVALIARRSVIRSFRQPGVWIPPLLFPLMLMAVNSNGLKAATHLPGFPTHSFLAFFLPFSFMQGALFASGIAGTDLARDIDTGFLNRLALTPVRGSALLLGQVGGALGIGTVQALCYLGVGLAAGVHIATGVPGALVILVLALLIAVGFAALGLWLALRTGSGEGVQSQFPILFFLLFISSMNLPRNLIEVGWFRDLATINPVSYLIEALRSLVIEGWNGEALGLGFGFTFALIAVAMWLAARQLKVRMART
jgi:ABC-2 type transport system permease protein